MKHDIEELENVLLLLIEKQSDIESKINIIKSKIQQKQNHYRSVKHKKNVLQNRMIAKAVLIDKRTILEVASQIGIGPVMARQRLHDHCFLVNPNLYCSFFEEFYRDDLMKYGFNYVGASRPLLKVLIENASMFV